MGASRDGIARNATKFYVPANILELSASLAQVFADGGAPQTKRGKSRSRAMGETSRTHYAMGKERRRSVNGDQSPARWSDLAMELQ